ncbi:sugar O-acyltransferase, sialic acid O-acetyltransferase NeuD family [Jannaschia faecimaris]|uniref:Sugar O-acyltransferase, sialic acid O-acetyltransferase NeuD family n=1 Tax=Jannaschia faecimaris TaxID=1244108 RepID=A0A1H3J9J8_9RHOB|nr:acetyltransferase [Jannaschia faecimaris]SDY36690.1 sugar O-acyltransferase, sialic acid O-acetyltransferase NeuD family [Jannaschia faecimaris]
MTLSRLVLIGFSGNMLEAFEAAQAQYEIAAILSDDPAHGPAFEGVPVHPLSAVPEFGDAQFLCLIGSEKSFRGRGALIARLGVPATRFARLIDGHAVVSRFAQVGAGSVLFSGATLTSNAVLGEHVMVLPQAVIHHDVTIGDHSIIGTHVTIAGGVRIGESCYVGSGATIMSGVQIGAGALVGMAANVIRDVAPGDIVAGNPARVLRGAGG